MISNSGKDENNKLNYGAAGDQNGREWAIIPWYNRPWSCVIRHSDIKVREMIAELSEKAAKNDNIGYDQSQRHTYFDELKKVGFDPSKIKTKCEADCSAGVIANTKAAGHILNIESLKKLRASYTGDMVRGYKEAGFIILRDRDLLDSDSKLLRGDILLYEGHHTAVNLTDGKSAPKTYARTGWIKDQVGWWYAFGYSKGQFHKNNAVRINNKLYFFDTEGYCVHPQILTNDKGELIKITGERVM